MYDIFSLLIGICIFFLVITLLPYLIWLFIILWIVFAIWRFFRLRKIRRQQENFYQNVYQDDNRYDSYSSGGFETKTTIDPDVIDVEFTEKDED